MKRTALRRRRLWRPPSTGPREDAVTDALITALWRVDRGCVAAQVDPTHGCRDRWGMPHAFDRHDLVTVEHFWPDYAVKGKRGPLTVLLCAYTNINAPSKELREKFREWRAARPLPDA